jgi:putative heme-binding domain-containing protein
MEEVGELAESMAQDAETIQRGYIPKSDKILVSSRLLQPGDSQAISFEAPQEPGVYPIICTYPGHWRRMHAALYVVESLDEFDQDADAFYAKNEPLIKDELLKLIGKEYEWTIEELVESVKPLEVPRSFEVGQSVFKVANCATCHQMGTKEGLQIGPDLTKLDTTKKNAEAILRSVIKPAETIEEKYQTNIFLLDTGLTVTGMILEETDETIKVIENPLSKAKPIVIEKDEIDERAKSTKSIMPEALTNRLNREELLDVIAYVYAKGDKKHKIYKGEGCHGDTGHHGAGGEPGQLDSPRSNSRHGFQ